MLLTNVRGMLFFLAMLLSSCQGALADSNSAVSRFYVTNCNQDISMRPSLVVRTVGAERFEAVSIHPVRARAGLYVIESKFDPGHFEARFYTAHCFQVVMFSVIANQGRSLAIALAPGGMTDYSSTRAIAGTLPVPASRVILSTLDRKRQWYLVIDQRAYYFEHLYPLKYVLRIETDDGLASDFDVDCSRVPDGVLFRKDISYREYRSHLGYPIFKDGLEVPAFWQERKI